MMLKVIKLFIFAALLIFAINALAKRPEYVIELKDHLFFLNNFKYLPIKK